MREPVTEIACIVDRSGSMHSIAEDAVGGFNRFLEEQKALPGRARLTLVLFDHEYQLLCAGLDLRRVPPLDERLYRPRGMTALLDAVGRTLDDLDRRFKVLPESERPDKVIVAILTDGLENASSDYSLKDVADRISEKRDRDGWDFVYLGANQDAFLAASELSIGAQDTHEFSATTDGVRQAFCCMSTVVGRRRRGSLVAGRDEKIS